MATPTIRDRIKALRRVRAGDLIPSPKNWRSHPQVQRDALNGVLAQVGYADAILVREVDDGGLEIIDGHLRVEEADPNQEIPVLVLDVSEEEAALLLATHDPLGAMAYPDLDLYLPLIEDLNPDSEAVAALLEAVANNEARPLWEPLVPEDPGLTDPDRVPDVDEKDTRVKLGQVWALGDHRLMCGDATGQLPKAYTESIDLTLTDPPYGIGIVKGLGTGDGERPVGRTGQPSGKPFGRVGGPNLVEPNLYHPITGDDRPFDPAWVLELKGDKIIFGAPYFCDKLPPGRKWLAWDKDMHEATTFSEVELVWTSFKGRLRLYRYMWSGLRRAGPRNEESIRRLHPTQKPVGLLAAILEDYSEPGAVVFDPYLGSGSTLIACDKTGRICRAIEIEPMYCDVAIRRWEEYTGNTAVLLEAQ